MEWWSGRNWIGAADRLTAIETISKTPADHRPGSFVGAPGMALGSTPDASLRAWPPNETATYLRRWPSVPQARRVYSGNDPLRSDRWRLSQVPLAASAAP